MTAMKGMMMAGMSLMISKWMLIQKLMDSKKGGGGGGGGPWQGGGGGGGKSVEKNVLSRSVKNDDFIQHITDNRQ